jgi:hypothetical protein
MGYTYPEDANLEKMTRYADRVSAGLLAVEELRELAPDWERFLAKVEGEAAARRGDERTELRAEALVDVRDTRWDKALGVLSAESFHASGKDAGKPPYAMLFRIPAKKAKGFGPNRAAAHGDDVLAQAARLAHAALVPHVEGFRQANDALKEAHTAHLTAKRAVQAHEIPRIELIDELQALMDKTEVEILKRFPGDDELLRAILAPERPRRRREEAATEPAAAAEPAQP